MSYQVFPQLAVVVDKKVTDVIRSWSQVGAGIFNSVASRYGCILNAVLQCDVGDVSDDDSESE